MMISSLWRRCLVWPSLGLAIALAPTLPGNGAAIPAIVAQVWRSPRPAPTAASANSQDIMTTIETATNQARQQAGRSPLTRSEVLSQAAQAHAEDMASGRFLSHTGSDGSTLVTRVTAVGYAYRQIGENVAYQGGYLDPQQVVADWMDSPGHRANILTAEFTEIGLGYAVNGNYHYFVQVFGRSR